MSVAATMARAAARAAGLPDPQVEAAAIMASALFEFSGPYSNWKVVEGVGLISPRGVCAITYGLFPLRVADAVGLDHGGVCDYHHLGPGPVAPFVAARLDARVAGIAERAASAAMRQAAEAAAARWAAEAAALTSGWADAARAALEKHATRRTVVVRGMRMPREAAALMAADPAVIPLWAAKKAEVPATERVPRREGWPALVRMR